MTSRNAAEKLSVSPPSHSSSGFTSAVASFLISILEPIRKGFEEFQNNFLKVVNQNVFLHILEAQSIGVEAPPSFLGWPV